MPKLPKQRWCEMSPRRRALTVAAVAVQVGLWAAMLVDLWRRPASAVNGSKRLWFGLSFVNFAGPLAYFAVGRRR
jgi:hypothetical protein